MHSCCWLCSCFRRWSCRQVCPALRATCGCRASSTGAATVCLVASHSRCQVRQSSTTFLLADFVLRKSYRCKVIKFEELNFTKLGTDHDNQLIFCLIWRNEPRLALQSLLMTPLPSVWEIWDLPLQNIVLCLLDFYKNTSFDCTF